MKTISPLTNFGAAQTMHTLVRFNITYKQTETFCLSFFPVGANGENKKINRKKDKGKKAAVSNFCFFTVVCFSKVKISFKNLSYVLFTVEIFQRVSEKSKRPFFLGKTECQILTSFLWFIYYKKNPIFFEKFLFSTRCFFERILHNVGYVYTF